jgi:DNA invertase Pin-like site-specific DNA recombinase
VLIGYARVSTGDQNLDLQKNALIRAECELIFEDKASARAPTGLKAGNSTFARRRYIGCLEVRSTGEERKDLITLVSDLQSRGVHFRSLTDSIDTSTPAGRFSFM